MRTTYQEFLAGLDPDMKAKDRQAAIDAWYDEQGLMRGIFCAKTEQPSTGWSYEDLKAECEAKGIVVAESAGKMEMLWELNPKDYPKPAEPKKPKA